MPGIVVGVDGSDHSRKALEWALDESALRRAPLTVIAVSPVSASIFGLSAQHYPADELDTAHVQDATEKLVQDVTAGRPAAGQEVAVRAVSGLPADELIRASAEADLLVLGARGAGGFRRLMLGSVSTEVSHHARCPVVIVPPAGER